MINETGCNVKYLEITARLGIIVKEVRMKNAVEAPDIQADDEVVWTPGDETSAVFIRNYGEGPFRVHEVMEKEGKKFAQITVPGGNRIRFATECFTKVPPKLATQH
jgi:hypothetical protein